MYQTIDLCTHLGYNTFIEREEVEPLHTIMQEDNNRVLSDSSEETTVRFTYTVINGDVGLLLTQMGQGLILTVVVSILMLVYTAVTQETFVSKELCLNVLSGNFIIATIILCIYWNAMRSKLKTKD